MVKKTNCISGCKRQRFFLSVHEIDVELPPDFDPDWILLNSLASSWDLVFSLSHSLWSLLISSAYSSLIWNQKIICGKKRFRIFPLKEILFGKSGNWDRPRIWHARWLTERVWQTLVIFLSPTTSSVFSLVSVSERMVTRSFTLFVSLSIFSCMKKKRDFCFRQFVVVGGKSSENPIQIGFTIWQLVSWSLCLSANDFMEFFRSAKRHKCSSRSYSSVVSRKFKKEIRIYLLARCNYNIFCENVKIRVHKSITLEKETRQGTKQYFTRNISTSTSTMTTEYTNNAMID